MSKEDIEYIDLGATVLFVMMLLYMVIGTYIRKNKCKFGHEAAYTILIGVFAGWVIKHLCKEEFAQMLKFTDTTFFYLCLPPIIFANGFNMDRGNFFANIKMILTLGVFSTLCAFVMFSLMTCFVNNKHELE